MTLPITTRVDLNQMVCGNPDCAHEEHPELYLHAVCHMRSGVFARYDRRTGLLTLLCVECRKKIARILVAQNMEQPQ